MGPAFGAGRTVAPVSTDSYDPPSTSTTSAADPGSEALPGERVGASSSPTSTSLRPPRRATKGAGAAVTTGQRHHVISARIKGAIERHPTLAGEFSRRDPRFITQAVDDSVHRGYQRWHRDLDEEVARWLGLNRNVTPRQFEGYLRNRYGQPDLRGSFPNGF